MFPRLSGFAWWNSPAHLSLLSEFLTPTPVDDYVYSPGWERALGEPPQQAIDRFLKEGMLVRAGLADHVAYSYDAAQLERMLEQRGVLPIGDKADLITTLLRVDRNALKPVFDDVIVLTCSDTGRRFAERYREKEADERRRIERKVLDALEAEEFRQAARLVVDYESNRVLPGGFDLDIDPHDIWKHHDDVRDGMILRRILTVRPDSVATLTERQLEQFRMAAAMMYLWGAKTPAPWLPDGFDAGIDVVAAATQIHRLAVKRTTDAAEDLVSAPRTRLSRQGLVDRTATARSRGAIPDLRALDLSGLDLSGVNLSNADLRYADLNFADLSGAHLKGADLAHATLRKASLRFANLRDANLRSADLRDADLFGATVTGAALDDADLTGVDFENATY